MYYSTTKLNAQMLKQNNNTFIYVVYLNNYKNEFNY